MWLPGYRISLPGNFTMNLTRFLSMKTSGCNLHMFLTQNLQKYDIWDQNINKSYKTKQISFFFQKKRILCHTYQDFDRENPCCQKLKNSTPMLGQSVSISWEFFCRKNSLFWSKTAILVAFEHPYWIFFCKKTI